MKKLLLGFILLFCAMAPVFAQTATVITNDRTGWQKIAETIVRFEREKDEILVLGADRFASIRFKVTDAPVELLRLEVHYESGDAQYISVNKVVSKEKESLPIDLNGGERRLKKIVFYYKTQANSADVKARMELWGLKTNIDKR